MEVTTETARRFKQTFFPAYKSPFGIRRVEHEWTIETRPGRYLTDAKVKAHLEGRYWVGPTSRTFTKSITVDLDAHDEWAKRDFTERARRTIDAMPDTPPLVFSTPRGGIHATWLLPEAVWSERARAFVLDQLDKSDIRPALGRVEIFPTGRQVLRAPLGRDCFLLDNDDLIPIGDRKACVEALDWMLRYDKVERLEIPPQYRSTLTPAGIRQGRSGPNSVSPWMRSMDDLLTFGLETRGTRNESLLNLCWFFHVVHGHDSETVVHDLRGWIDTRHNGFSDDYNRDPETVYQHIERIVSNFAWSKVPNPQYGGRRKHGGSNFGWALDYLIDLSLNERARRLLAHFIDYATRRGELRGFGFEVRIPSRTLKSWDRRYGPQLRLLIKRGHLAPGPNYTTLGKAQTYRVLTYPREPN